MRAVRIFGSAAVAFACAAVTAQAAPTLASGSAQPALRLCADPVNLPFSSQNVQTPGLYVEIGRAIAQALGRPLETVWSHSNFGKRNLRSTLLAGQCDLAIGLPHGEGFMEQRLVFTRPILRLGYALVVPKGQAAKSLDDLKGKRVAVQFDSPPQSIVAERGDMAGVTAMSPEDALQRLARGEADAAFVWSASAGWLNRMQYKDAYDVIDVEAPQMQWPAAIAFDRKQGELRDSIDVVLPQLEARIAELRHKYAVVAGPAIVLADKGASLPSVTVGTTNADGGNIEAGRKVFDSTCAHCHGPNAVTADRKINLRLLTRRYGEEMGAVFLKTVNDGRPSKGMPAWKGVFSVEDFANILDWLKTVQEH